MNKNDDNSRVYDVAVLTALLLIGISLVSIFIPYDAIQGLRFYGFEIDIKKYDKLGSFLSGVAAPYSSVAAFIMLYKTYSTQQKEMVDNRNFIHKQNDYIDGQKFESILFKMIEMHQSLAKDVSFVWKDNLIVGKAGFSVFLSFFDKNSDNIIDEVKAHHALYLNPFNVYLNFFFIIISFIDKYSFGSKEGNIFYLDLFIASLSEVEAEILYLFCLFVNDKEKSDTLKKYGVINKLKLNK